MKKKYLPEKTVRGARDKVSWGTPGLRSPGCKGIPVSFLHVIKRHSGHSPQTKLWNLHLLSKSFLYLIVKWKGQSLVKMFLKRRKNCPKVLKYDNTKIHQTLIVTLILARLAFNLRCPNMPPGIPPEGSSWGSGQLDRWGFIRVPRLSLKQLSGQEISQVVMKANAGKTSPRPNPPRGWVKYWSRRRGPGGRAPLEGQAGGARSLRQGGELGRAREQTRWTHRVPRQPRGSRLQLSGRPDGAGAAYLDDCVGTRRSSAGTPRGRGAGRRRGSGGAGDAAHWTPPGLRSAASGRKWCQPCPSHAARRREAPAAPLCIEGPRGRSVRDTHGGVRVDADSWNSGIAFSN